MNADAWLKNFMRTMKLRLLVLFLAVVVAPAAAYVYSALNHAINYTKIEARVERYGVLCRSKGTSIAEAVECSTPGSASSADKVIRNAAVFVQYTSPADGRQHQGRVVAVGKKISQVRNLRQGDSLTIWAHDDEPETIKIY